MSTILIILILTVSITYLIYLVSSKDIKLSCKVFGHKYRYIRCERYIDISYDTRMPSTISYWRCSKCSKVKHDLHYGDTLYDEDFREPNTITLKIADKETSNENR